MSNEQITYQDGPLQLQGYMAYPKTSNKSPAVIVIHDWSGNNDFARSKAEYCASLGYVGFAVDMYGEGKVGTTIEEKSALIQPFKDNRELSIQRLQAACEKLQQCAQVDTQKIAIMGFCFGGMCALDFARSGADFKAAISIHGLLMSAPHMHNPITAKILALHGHDDPMVPVDQVVAFQQEMTQAKADWQLHTFGNTKHAFTNPAANDATLGTVYNEYAAQRTFKIIEAFLTEVFI
ncbi:MAG: dienelactone hydrolase family protein [Gammaproteobacteria bacterium]